MRTLEKLFTKHLPCANLLEDESSLKPLALAEVCGLTSHPPGLGSRPLTTQPQDPSCRAAPALSRESLRGHTEHAQPAPRPLRSRVLSFLPAPRGRSLPQSPEGFRLRLAADC